jgi:hypothetical protein
MARLFCFAYMDIPIIKIDDAHKGLLERDAATAMAAQFKDAIDLLEELVNYGTKLVVRAFDSSKRDLIAIDQAWYKVYGATSIRSIAEELGRLKEYTYIYSVLSGVTHGSDIWKSVFFGEGKVEVTPLRETQHIPKIVQLGATLALRVYRLILQEFRPGEEENFDRKYIHEWRERFLRKYQIELTPRVLII